MIEKYAHLFTEKIGPTLLKKYSEEHPAGYQNIFLDTVAELNKHIDCEFDRWDCSKTHIIDDGEYQGTLVFLVPAECYQPSTYLMCKVFYGSCSGCDTFQNIRGYDDEKPNEIQAKEYVQLALHMVQAMKEV